MTVISLSAKQGSGKTTLQKALVEALWNRFELHSLVINFADPLYEMHDAVLKVLNQWYPDRGLAKDGPLLQLLGTDWGRKTINDNIWVDLTKARVKQAFKDNPKQIVIIGDCRFQNEFHAFPNALRVRLQCPEAIRKIRCSMWRENTEHPSEVGLDQYDARGWFDLYIDTWKTPVEGCVDLVIAQLQKGSWLEKRDE